MNKYMRLALGSVFAALLIVLFSGCTMQGGDSLLSLPNLPTEYVQLESRLQAILNSGAQYTSPEVGNDRQSVQMIDLDSDGENEVVEVLQKGYIRGDKVIRYAVVKVAN